MATKPTITITFKQLATTLIKRSERGTAILLLSDDTAGDEANPIITTEIYKTVADINESLYTEENIAHIKSCLSYTPYELVVISGNSTRFSDFAKAIMTVRRTGWIAFAGSKEPQADLASWIKSMERQGYTYKAVGTQSGTDCKQYVYFNQSTADKNKNIVLAEDYLPSLLGILAGCNISRGCTNFLCTDLSEVSEVDDIDKAISNGQLVLTNDINGVIIVAGVNSLITLNKDTATIITPFTSFVSTSCPLLIALSMSSTSDTSDKSVQRKFVQPLEILQPARIPKRLGR